MLLKGDKFSSRKNIFRCIQMKFDPNRFNHFNLIKCHNYVI